MNDDVQFLIILIQWLAFLIFLKYAFIFSLSNLPNKFDKLTKKTGSFNGFSETNKQTHTLVVSVCVSRTGVVYLSIKESVWPCVILTRIAWGCDQVSTASLKLAKETAKSICYYFQCIRERNYILYIYIYIYIYIYNTWFSW